MHKDWSWTEHKRSRHSSSKSEADDMQRTDRRDGRTDRQTWPQYGLAAWIALTKFVSTSCLTTAGVVAVE